MLKYNDIISKLADYQKVKILTEAGSLSGKDMKILGIPSVKTAAMKDYGRDVYPNVTALAHSWDREIWHSVAAEKTDMMVDDGVKFAIAPGAKIKISPYRREIGEDPYHASQLSAEHIKAATEKGLKSGTSGYYLTDSDVRWMDKEPSERILNEFVVSPFKRAVSSGDALAVVTDLREPGEAYKNSCRYLQDRISKEVEFAVCERATDENTVELVNKKTVCLSGSANALEGAMNRYKRLKKSVELGDGVTFDQLAAEEEAYTAISDETVDAAVDKTLDFIFTCHAQGNDTPKNTYHQTDVAKRATYGSAVLLKNKNGSLPLSKEGKIGIIGDIIFDEQNGEKRAERLRRELEARGYTCSGTAPGYDRENMQGAAKVSEAVRLTRDSDVVLLFLGFGYEAEKRIPKTETLSLPANQLYLADELSMENKRIIAVISSGHAPDIAFTRRFSAVLMLPLEVKDSIDAVTAILAGEYNPSGKLAYTLYAGSDNAFAKDAIYRKKRNMKSGPFVGYRYYDSADMYVGYPFGHGLSYTSFNYSNLKSDGKTVSFTLENIGNVKGAEVAQVYLGIKNSAVIRAKKELVGFVKAELNPGERRTLSLDIEIPEVFTDGGFVAEDGVYTVYVGSSVSDLRLEGTVKVSGEKISPDGERLADYLQTVSNVKEDNYTLEANYSFMKKSVKNILFGIGAIALAISVAVFNAISEESSLFIGAVAGILAVCAIIFFVMEAVERSRAYNEEREAINAANKEQFAGAEEIPVFSTEAMFAEEFDVSETETLTINDFVSEVVEENNLEFIDSDFRIASAVEELKSFISSRGYKTSDSLAEGLLSTIATNGLIITAMPSDDFNAFVKLISEYFGGEAYVDVADKASANGNALFDYDYHGDHAKKNLLLALDSAMAHAERVVFAALDKVSCGAIDGYLAPFMRYLHSPKAKNQIVLHDVNGNNNSYVMAPNLRFIINLDSNESVDMLPSFIASLACVHKIELTPCQPTELSGARTLNRYQLEYMAEKESGAEISEDNFKKIDKLEKYVSKISEYSIGNKLWLGFEKQLGLLVSAGLDVSDAVDVAVSARLLASMSVAVKDKITDDDQTLAESLEFIFGEDKISVGKSFLNSLVFTPVKNEADDAQTVEAAASVEEPKPEQSSTFSSLFSSSAFESMTASPIEQTPEAEPTTESAPAEETAEAEPTAESAPAEETAEAESTTESAPVDETPEAESATESAPVDETPEADPTPAQSGFGSGFSGSFMDMFKK